MNIYVCGATAEIERVKPWVAKLKEAGFVVVSTWVDMIAEQQQGAANPRDASTTDRRAWSHTDLAEVASADIVWFLVPDSKTPTRGGWVELGFAYGWVPSYRHRAAIWCSGDTKQSIFCALGHETATDEEAFDQIITYRDRHAALA